MSYKWIETNVRVKRLSDGAAIPNEPANRDWRIFQAWVAGGGVTQAADSPAVPTASQLIDAYFPQTGTARVLFEALFSLSNQARELRTQMNAELVARGQPAAYPNNATEGGAAQVTRPQLKGWLESKLP